MSKQGRKRCSEKITGVLDYRRLNGEPAKVLTLESNLHLNHESLENFD